MRFKPIDLVEHEKFVLNFRKDSFAVSFNDTSSFNEEEYLRWLKEKINEFPEGFVMAEAENELIGQLELSIRQHEGQPIGYVHLYYLKPECRHKGHGIEIHRYALDYFLKQNVNEYHLRVSPTNTSARKFYKRMGMKEVAPELDGKVIRMRGILEE
ncbi:GNAT family N-acetyltransferase [Bacillus sp. AK031]